MDTITNQCECTCPDPGQQECSGLELLQVIDYINEYKVLPYNGDGTDPYSARIVIGTLYNPNDLTASIRIQKIEAMNKSNLEDPKTTYTGELTIELDRNSVLTVQIDEENTNSGLFSFLNPVTMRNDEGVASGALLVDQKTQELYIDFYINVEDKDSLDKLPPNKKNHRIKLPPQFVAQF